MKIEIEKWIEGLDPHEVAKAVFPSHRYPKAALDRVLKGETSLDVPQLERLADYIGVEIVNLFTDNGWKGTSEKGALLFKKGQFVARLQDDLMVVTKGGNEIDKIVVPKPTRLSELLKEIDGIINQKQ